MLSKIKTLPSYMQILILMASAVLIMAAASGSYWVYDNYIKTYSTQCVNVSAGHVACENYSKNATKKMMEEKLDKMIDDYNRKYGENL